ncbi:MAG: hypothetical protein LIP28_10220 [Deltaproteobacteria bacterium]|nr:hypothetical protein [Deltaproteobacteria bacterium]
MAKAYDPAVHTAEHVLNRTMIRLFDCGRCYTSHINPGKGRCDFHFPRDLTGPEADAVEAAVNGILARDLPVAERELPRREAEKLADLSKLPASVGPDDPIRIVTVGDYDVCACIGAHAASTGEVGAFHLVTHDFLPDAAKGPTLRLRFRLEPRP